MPQCVRLPKEPSQNGDETFADSVKKRAQRIGGPVYHPFNEPLARHLLGKLAALRRPELLTALKPISSEHGKRRAFADAARRLEKEGLVIRKRVEASFHPGVASVSRPRVKVELTELGRRVADELRPWTEESVLAIAERLRGEASAGQSDES
jgi:DNA-binding HxlR family transcriptional regulator